MPLRLLRLVLALALALAVPLQGFAAASAGLCMAFGHHDAAATHAHDTGAGDHHSHDEGQAASPHCPPCVACCASAAITPAVSAVVADGRPDAVNATAPPFFAGIKRTVVDRPPLAL